MNLKKKLEKYLRVNLLEPGPRLMKKRIYRAAVSQRLRSTAIQELSGRIQGTFYKMTLWSTVLSVMT